MNFNLKHIAKKNKTILFGILYLFQISAIIGISIRFQEWFITKTPLLLLLNLVFLVLLYPLQLKNLGVLLFLFFAGMGVEWFGIRNDFLFGAYYYGNNLGPKVYGVPFLIGCNWLVLVVSTAAIARKFLKNKWLVASFGAFLMVFLDFFIEPYAPKFDFWIWEKGHAPLQNFIAWFIISCILQFVFIHFYKKKASNFGIALHIYISQLIFFAYFYFVGNV